MAGYWNRPEETAAALVEGRLRTGDVGYMDEDGYTFIIDRIKDLVLVSGFNVYPRNVEEGVYQHPAVAECTVIGIADDYSGEAVKAFVKLKEGQSLTAEELSAFLEDKLGKHEQPKHIEFCDELPKTMVGKLSKKELVAEEAAKSEAAKGQARAAAVVLRGPPRVSNEGRGLTPAFGHFIGVDFSGARGPALPGLQVARCRPGNGAPRLVSNPAGGHWTRAAFAAWLARCVSRDGPVLCGLDFAFALPYDGAYLPGSRLSANDARGLWRLVEESCGGAGDDYGGGFATRFGEWFLTARRRGERYARRLRTTDRACGAAGLGRPETPFKLVGPKQVGKAAFAGMRLLIALTRANAGSRYGRSTRAGPAHRSWSKSTPTPSPRGRAWQARYAMPRPSTPRCDTLRAVRLPRLTPTAPSTSRQDRRTPLGRRAPRPQLRPAMWRPAGLTAATRRREGWIFGVA